MNDIYLPLDLLDKSDLSLLALDKSWFDLNIYRNEWFNKSLNFSNSFSPMSSPIAVVDVKIKSRPMTTEKIIHDFFRS
ncbi:hypothetical protein ACFL9U_17965 [Thermodesulfobacteriota bacterium]